MGLEIDVLGYSECKIAKHFTLNPTGEGLQCHHRLPNCTLLTTLIKKMAPPKIVGYSADIETFSQN